MERLGTEDHQYDGDENKQKAKKFRVKRNNRKDKLISINLLDDQKFLVTPVFQKWENVKSERVNMKEKLSKKR